MSGFEGARRDSDHVEGHAHQVSRGLSGPSARTTGFVLAAITLVAAFLRLFHFGSSPPGLNQDEAVNAWNAFCLLRTGHDMAGARWPVFYAHAIGDNRTPLFSYALIPFQALGGHPGGTAPL